MDFGRVVPHLFSPSVVELGEGGEEGVGGGVEGGLHGVLHHADDKADDDPQHERGAGPFYRREENLLTPDNPS